MCLAIPGLVLEVIDAATTAWGTRHGDNFDYYLGAGAILMLVSLFGSAFA